MTITLHRAELRDIDRTRPYSDAVGRYVSSDGWNIVKVSTAFASACCYGAKREITWAVTRRPEEDELALEFTTLTEVRTWLNGGHVDGWPDRAPTPENEEN